MKIVTVFLRYGYGKKELGDSLEYIGFYMALKKITDEVYPFWFDDYLDRKEQLQKDLIGFVDEIKPEIVFFTLYTDQFEFSTLDYLKKKYATINWFWDDEWRFDSFTRYYAPHFSYCITKDKYILEKYDTIGYKNVILIPPASFGYIPNIDFEKIQYKYDVSFVGGINRYRKWLIKELKKKGIYVDCFGQGWSRGQISFEEVGYVYMTSKINLNLSNSVSYDIRYVFSSLGNLREFCKSPKRVEQLKARNFEIPAFGGFQLSQYALSLEDYFSIGKEIAIFTSIDDLIVQIRYYLNHEEERKKIMIAGYNKVTEYGPTYMERFKEIFSRIIQI